MATGLSGSFELDCTSSLFKLRVNWAETYDASTNKSTVTISSVEFKSTGWYGFTYYPDGVIKVNGTTVITMNSNLGDHNCRAGSLNSWTTIKKSGGAVATGSTDIVHNADGKKSITIEVAGNRFSRCYFYTVNGDDGGSGWGCTGSKSVDLQRLPHTHCQFLPVQEAQSLLIGHPLVMLAQAIFPPGQDCITATS